MSFSLTVTLAVTGRRAVVVGGGPEAVARVDELRHGDAEVVVLSPAPAPALAAHAAAGRLVLHRRGWRPGDLAGAFVAYVTREDPTPVAAVWAEAERERVLLSTLDDVPHCHFATPSVLRRGDLAVTIATAGRAPALAKRLRRRLEAELGAEYHDLVDVLAAARRSSLPRTVPFATWAARWEQALDDLDGLLALVRDGRPEAAHDRVVAALRGPVEVAS